jgi:hypothetical protein
MAVDQGGRQEGRPHVTNAVTTGSETTLVWLNLRMCAMHFELPKPPPKDAKGGGRRPGDALLEGFTLQVLAEAYVVFLQLSDEDTSIQPDGKDKLLARTTSTGALMKVTEEELSAEVPSDPTKALWLQPEAEYAFFWTKDWPIFLDVLRQLDEDAGAAITKNPFSKVLLRRSALHKLYNTSDHVFETLARTLNLRSQVRLELLLHDEQGMAGDRLIHGYFTGKDLERYAMGAKSPFDKGELYLIGRAEALEALFAAEIIAAEASYLRALSFDDFGVFHTVQGFARYAEDGQRVKELDDALMTFESMGKPRRANPLNQQYFDYAYACARARVERDLFWQSINVLTGQSGWRDAAELIQEQGKKKGAAPPLVHPALAHGIEFIPNKEPIVYYFDFYAYGTHAPGEPWYNIAVNEERRIEEQLARLRARLSRYFARCATYGDMLQDLGAHCDGTFEERAELHTRYVWAALRASYKWWEDFPVESDVYWARMERYASWFASVSDKGGELLGRVFGDPQALARHNEVLAEAVDEFKKMFGKIENFDKRFKSRTALVERRIGVDMTIEVDFQKGTFVAKKSGEVVHEVGPVYFLVDESVRKQVERVRDGVTKKGRRRYREVTRETVVGRAYVAEVPFKNIHRWPAYLGAFGDLLSLGIAIATLSRDLKERSGIEVYGKLAMNVLQATDSVSCAIYVAFRATRGVPGLFKFAGGMGLAVEAIFNVKEGHQLLFDEESDVVKALAAGDEVTGWVLATKGWVLISSATPGAVAFLGGMVATEATAFGAVMAASASAAMTPLGIGLAVGALLIVGLDAYLYARSGPDDAMTEIKERVAKAVKNELGANLENYPGHTRTLRPLEKLVHDAEVVLDLIHG